VADQAPDLTASEADARRFPRIIRPSPAAVVAAAGAIAVLGIAYQVGDVLAIFLIGLIFAYAYIFRRAAGLEPNPALAAAAATASPAAASGRDEPPRIPFE
jgi:4-hydroxybenzoate polyprenyltransferase